ncbi:hypothetical protein PRUPE_6G052200 [Prunus persica]|uniref:Retrotransposon Copia-like N-terminal domain-containing protein n=1 Tax=Prunus persica TaxID=3760 RepID=M5W3Z0_PRUPE|nr:hypothetical protein PRUPE_6G052200 [Prunus persica]
MSSSAASSSSVLIVSSSNISNFLTIKLDRTNFPLWLAKIVPLLRSHNLLSFVDGSSICPAAFLTDAEGKLTKYQDQQVLSWLNSSLSSTVLSTVALSSSARTTWVSLENRYASQSHNRILQLRSDLMRTTRGDLSIADYLDMALGEIPWAELV